MSVIWTIVLVLAIAMVLGAILERFKQSAIIGYLLAGALIDPSALGLIAESQQAMLRGIADAGVALLLFTIGLEFNLGRLRKFGWTPWAMGSLQVFGTTALIAAVTLLWLPMPQAVSLGAVVALSSTAVVIRTLSDRAELDAVHGRQALGILLFQDVMVVPLMVLIAAINGDGSIAQVGVLLVKEIGLTVLLLAGFFVLTQYGMPYLVKWGLLSGANREVPVLFAIVSAGGAAFIAEEIGLSAALGAFVAGVMLGESVLATQIRADISGVKTVFVTLFFTSVGLLADPVWIIHNLEWVIPGVLILVSAKFLVVVASALALRLRIRDAVATGLTVSQIGEFSFVLLAAMSPGEELQNLLVAITIGSLFVTPFMIGSAEPAGRLVERLVKRGSTGRLVKHVVSQAASHASDMSHTVVIGFGPAGREVAERVHLAGRPVTVLDLNPQAIREALEQGFHGYVGDVTSAEVLAHAHVENAEAVVITLPDARIVAQVAERIRAMSASPLIIARSRYHRFVGMISMAGAGKVIDEETTVGEKLADEVTRCLQLDEPKPVSESVLIEK